MDFINQITSRLKEFLSKRTKTEKFIVLGAVVAIVFTFVLLAVFSSEESRVLLYKNGLKKADFQRVTAKLDGMKVDYTSSNDRYIFVDSGEKATQLRAQLGVQGVVQNVRGFELFDNTEFSTTDFERKINLRRAVTGNMVKHLEALEDIEKAQVTISFGDSRRFYRRDQDENPLTASISITPASFSDIRENKNKLRGLRDFIAKGIDRLKPENVIILDQATGVDLTDKIEPSPYDEDMRMIREHAKHKRKVRQEAVREVRTILSKIYDERYELTLTVDLNYDSMKENSHRIDPLNLKDPKDIYAKSDVRDGARTSIQTKKETFQGRAFIPQGPAGTSPNVAPGALEQIDQPTIYTNNTETINLEHSTTDTETVKQPVEEKGMRIAVAIDAQWEEAKDKNGTIIVENNGKIKRLMTWPPNKVQNNQLNIDKTKLNADLNNLKKLLEAKVNKKRGDIVAVRFFKFDHSKEWAKRDEELSAQKRNRFYLIAAGATIAALIFIFILYRIIKQTVDRRRRLREEEFAREQQAMREAALLAAEEEGIMIDLQPEDKARLEMQENAINIAKDKPQEVAQLIRTWLAED